MGDRISCHTGHEYENVIIKKMNKMSQNIARAIEVYSVKVSPFKLTINTRF